MKYWWAFAAALLVAVLLAVVPLANAEDLLMVRSRQPFPEAMLALQDAITDHGYLVSRVQRVDVGLTRAGFKTGKYRVVFFGKPAQLRNLAKNYPELIPYLPLKVAIFAEGKETIVVAANPLDYERFFPHASLRPVFAAWARDLQGILEEVRKGD